MRDQVDIDPGGGGAAAAELDGDVDHQAEIGLDPAEALWPQDPPQTGPAQILDGLVGNAADALGFRRALAQHRDERARGLDELFAGGICHRVEPGSRNARTTIAEY